MMRLASALQEAQMQATLARAGQGAGQARIRIYATNRPAQSGAHQDAPLCEITLAKPCGSVQGGQLTLTASAPALVLAAGIPRWAEWIAADGALLLDTSVTDAANAGDFIVTGASTPEGQTAPFFLAGAMLTLDAVVLT